MKILVTGGTGTVGSQVVNELIKRKAEVTVLTRKAKSEVNLPKGVNYMQGDLLNPETVRNMCNGMDALFLLLAVSPTETHEGLMALNGAMSSSISKIVYLSVHKADEAPYLPHFGAKLPIETTIKASGIPYTILRPNNFYQNDYWYQEAMKNFGVYPQPFGNTGLSRVDVRDIAKAAAITLLDDKYKHNTFNLVGPDIYTAIETAETWSRALKNEIQYSGSDLDAWEKSALEIMPDWMVFDFKLMYKFFQDNGLKATNEDIRKLTALLGHSPRSFDDFANQTAEHWKKPAAKK